MVSTEIDPDVLAVFYSYPDIIRDKLLHLRKLILETAAITDGVGPVTETLKWGEPAYLTEVTNSGSTIRFGWKHKHPGQFGVFFICNTTLIETFREQYRSLTYEGNRAIIFGESELLPEDDLCACFAAALTYHKRKKVSHRDR